MSTDEELFEEMKRQEESPDDPRARRTPKPVYAKSEFTVEELTEKFGERVWVKCITDLKPWADNKPLDHWKDYEIPVAEAIALDERRFAVILVQKDEKSKTTSKKKETK